MRTYTDDKLKVGRRWSCAWVLRIQVLEYGRIRSEPAELVGWGKTYQARSIGLPDSELFGGERGVAMKVVEGEVRVDQPGIT